MLEGNQNKNNCLVSYILQQKDLSRTILCAEEVGEKNGKFQFAIEIPHKKVILILISL